MRVKVGDGERKEEAGLDRYLLIYYRLRPGARALGQWSSLVMCFLAWRANEATPEVARASGMGTEALF